MLFRAKLENLLHARPRTRNVTRWSSVCDMIFLYIEYRKFLQSSHYREIDSFSLNAPEKRRVNKILEQLRPLKSVKKMLQNTKTTIRDSRPLFDNVTKSFPDTSDKLSSTVGTIYFNIFENALVKLQMGHIYDLLY